ncbi:stage II sporulation protein R [Bacillus tianshenii]|nr:stage II sporulation protein R [Bacillus tianshenii]
MKKLAIIYFILSYVGVVLFQQYDVQAAGQQNEGAFEIPKEAIRLRILANSDSMKDQQVKRLVRDEVNKQINLWVADMTSIEEARTKIKSSQAEIEAIVEAVLAEQQSDEIYSVDFEMAKFPTKMYGQFIYPAGTYEAVVITLGEGKGANWWCVLFPPLCFLDFSNGDAVKAETPDKEEEKDETEIKFFVFEWLKKAVELFS